MVRLVLLRNLTSVLSPPASNYSRILDVLLIIERIRFAVLLDYGAPTTESLAKFLLELGKVRVIAGAIILQIWCTDYFYDRPLKAAKHLRVVEIDGNIFIVNLEMLSLLSEDSTIAPIVRIDSKCKAPVLLVREVFALPAAA
jgi:hypothetical protein